MAALPCAPLPDTQVTKAHPNSPSRPTTESDSRGAQPRTLPESWFPWDISVTSACPWGIHYISSIQSSCQQPGEDIRHNSGTKPTAQPSRDGWSSTINKDPETACKTWFVNVHWLTRSETVLQRTIITANWAIVCCMRSTVCRELYRAYWATTFVRGSVAFVKGEGSE